MEAATNKRGVLHHALAHQRARTAFRQIAVKRALVAPPAKLVNKTGHEAARQRRRRRGRRFRLDFLQVAAGELQDLLEGLLNLAGDLGVNAVTAAGCHVEMVVFGELIGAHQGEKIRFGAGLKQLARLRNVFVIASEAGEQVAPADQGGAKGGGGDAAEAGGLHQHAGIARVHGQTEHLPADGR